MPPLFIVNDEQERETSEFAKVISQIGEKLAKGSVRIKGVEVSPPVKSHCVIRYEQTPHHSFKLKIEMEWHERGSVDDNGVPLVE